MENNSGTESGDSFSSVKETIAEKLERAAVSLGRQSEGAHVLGLYSQQASQWLHQSADYVRDFDVKKADKELRNQIRTHPGKSLLIGFGAGMLLGLLLRRR
jgi:ElaB/YqjD/DUF883 family membrane-anchored ribosome-binding protein